MADSIAAKDAKDEHNESLDMTVSPHDRVLIETREPYGPSGMYDSWHILRIYIDLL